MNTSSKTVLMLRHGKSDWGASFASDHERPLARRGRRASRLLGRWTAGAEMVPDLALTSDAVRARTTVELAAEAGGWSSPIQSVPEFYSGSAEDLVATLCGLDEAVETVLLAGHLPTWPRAIEKLIGGGRLRFPTAALAALGYAGSWRSLGPGRCELLWLVTPKLLAKAGAE